MSHTVRISEEDYEQIVAAQEVLELSFPDVLHLGLWTDLLKGSPRQNATRAVQNYYTFILGEYDDPAEVPVEELGFDAADQAKTAMTIGQEKRENWEAQQSQ